MIGEHVGASPAHSTHRATTQELRMAMAFFGHMGIEWNLLKEPQEDIEKLAEWVAEFKKHREWFAVDTSRAFRRSRSGSALGRCGHA